MGVTSSFLNKKQRASYGNSASVENRNKGSMGMYGGNGDDDSMQSGDDGTRKVPRRGNGTTNSNNSNVTTNGTDAGANGTTNTNGDGASTIKVDSIPLPERVKYSNLADIANTVRELGYSVETPEEKKKREDAERKKKLRTSIGDGLSALASAFFVNAGGLPTYDPKDNAYNRLKAELKEGETKREKQRAEWLAAMERAIARNREDVNAENAHNWKEYGAKVDESDKKRQQANADRAYNLELNKFNTSTNQWQQKFEHEKYVDKETLKINRAKVAQATADANKSSANAQRYKIAVSKAWAKLAAIAKEKDDQGKLKYPDLEAQMKAVGNPVYDSKKRNLIGHYAPTTDQQLSLIMQIGEAQQVFDDYWEGRVDDGEFNRDDYSRK